MSSSKTGMVTDKQIHTFSKHIFSTQHYIDNVYGDNVYVDNKYVDNVDNLKVEFDEITKKIEKLSGKYEEIERKNVDVVKV